MTNVEKQLLRDLGVALDDWLHGYAGELCSESYVQQSAKRIEKDGGTLAYIAKLRRRVHEALGEKPKTWGEIMKRRKRVA